MRTVAVSAKALCVLALSGSGTGWAAISQVSASSEALKAYVQVAPGRRLYLECEGTGTPTVLLEAGLRVRSDYWSHNEAQPPAESVFPAVSRFTRVCIYDRPGTVIGTTPDDRSRSDPVPMPRSAMSAVEDLHALIEAAPLPGPLVLVGHSTGGLLALLYAYRFPADVGGLVLVDALPGGLQRLMSPQQFAIFLRLNTAVPASLADYKDYETIPFVPAFDALQKLAGKAPLKRMPLVVLARGRPEPIPADAVPAGFSAALESAWRLEQKRLVGIEPGARLIVASQSGHYIMLSEPGLVIEAIRSVVDSVRSGSAVPTSSELKDAQ